VPVAAFWRINLFHLIIGGSFLYFPWLHFWFLAIALLLIVPTHANLITAIN